MTRIGDHRRFAVSRLKPQRVGVSFCLALSMSMTAFSFYGAEASVFEKARGRVLDLFEPALVILGGPIRLVGEGLGNAQDYFRLHQENRRLREENADLRAWQQEALNLKRQLSYYEALYETRAPAPATFLTATVIGETNGPYDRSLILSAGMKDGVLPGRAVVDAGGLLGHVVSAGGEAARVLMLTDFESRVPVVIEELQVDALLRGRADGKPVLDVVADGNAASFVPGQRVVTSGAGGMLPRGVPIGEIAAVNDQAVSVTLYANTRTPSVVRVVDYRFPQGVDSPEGQAAPLVPRRAGEAEDGGGEPNLDG